MRYLKVLKEKSADEMTILDWFCFYVFPYGTISIGAILCFLSLILVAIEKISLEGFVFLGILGMFFIFFGFACYKYFDE